jgi:type VI secretion system secreted protein VgrG
MLNSGTAYSDDLLATTWLGEVVDIEDPQKVGRVKVKVYGKFDDLQKEDIPWAYPGNNMTGGSPSGGGFFSVPKLGSIVSVKFDMGNIYHPEYFFEQKISDEVKEEISGSYTNAHVIIYDTVTEGSLKIFFTETKGLMLDYKETQINIKPDKSIDIHTASGNSKIELLDDGTLNVTHTNNINIKTDKNINITAAKDAFIKCKTADVTASTKAIIDSPKIELGRSATEAVIKGNAFAEIFDNHIHPTPAGPSSKPTQSMKPTLSKVSTTK